MPRMTLTNPRLKAMPIVFLTNKEYKPGAVFTGKLLTTGKEINLNPGKKWVYEFAIQDVKDAPIKIKESKEAGYVEYTAKVNERIVLFFTENMHLTLQEALINGMVKVGDTLELTYQGAAPSKRGNPAHKVEIVKVS